MVHKFYCQTAEEEILINSFYEASLILLTNQTKTLQENY